MAVHIVQATRTPVAQYSPDFAAVPMAIGDYQGETLPIEASVYRFLETDVLLERRYAASGSTIRLSLIYAANWRSLHSPAGCYPAQGWQIIADEQIEIPAPANSPTSAPLEARLLRVKKNGTELLAMFTFCHPGGTTGDWVQQGWRLMRGPRGAGGVVISLSTPARPDLTAARQGLTWFLGQIYPFAVAFWYQEK